MLMKPPSPVTQAKRDLAALALILAGTLSIFGVGVPALLPILLTQDDGTVLTQDNGSVITNGDDPESAAARRTYWLGAGGGMVAITLGMGIQGIAPLRVILRARQGRKGMRL